MNIPCTRNALGLVVFWVAAPAFGITSIASIEPTQMQAKITVLTDQAGFCTYRASRGAVFNSNIPDLVDNSNTDARAGSVVNGNRHVFILGTRKANDALAAAAIYWTGVTCGSDSEVSAAFATRPIPWGNTAPDILPFKSSALFGNMDHPVIDWNGTAAANTFCDPASHSYCDPNTGVEYWVASKPGWNNNNGFTNAAGAGTWFQPPIDVTGGKWSSPSNATSNGASFTVASGGPSDKLFIPLNGVGSAFSGNSTTDDLIFSVYCGSGAVSGITLTLQLGRWNAGSLTAIGSPVTTAACPTAAPGFLGFYPNAGNPANLVAQAMFKGWGVNGIPVNHLRPPGSQGATGTVSVATSTVTLGGSPGPSNYFDLDWSAGQPITINGAYAHLASAPTTSTTLTVQENLGTLTNVAYTGTELGLIITKSNNGSNVSVAVGYNGAGSSMPNEGVNGDTGMLNLASVSVSKSADGASCGIYAVGCSGGTLSPPIAGYIGGFGSIDGHNAVFLWLPYNSDGTPRGETRLLTTLTKPPSSGRAVGNGDSVSGVISLNGAMWFDNLDGTAIYAVDQNNKRLWKLAYNEGYGGSCTGYQSYSPFPNFGGYNNNGATNASNDCFTWIVMTPLAGGKDVRTQVMGTAGNNGAYQSGLNYIGQSVGAAHAGFDLGWMGVGGTVGSDGGLVSIGIQPYQNGPGLLATFGDDGSGNGTYVVKSIHNTWGETNLRWGGSHACPLQDMGTYRFCVIDGLVNTGSQASHVFANSHQASVTQFNRAGFGATANWVNTSTTTMTANSDFYACPSGLPAPYAGLSGTVNCVQVRISTPFCNQNPNSSYIFPSTNTEKTEFPCITPGFGVANANYSKLQDVQKGDWLIGDSERFTIVTAPVYNSATDITFWMLRTMGWLFNTPTYGFGDETAGLGHTTSGIGCCTHSPGWFLWAAPSPGAGNSAVVDVSNPANTWSVDNGYRFSAHATVGPGLSPGTYSFSQASCGAQSNFYCGNFNLAPAAVINIPFVKSAVQLPTFAGITQNFNGGIQSYQNATYSTGASSLPFYVDFQAINPAGPSGAETPNPFGNTLTMALVSGTTNTYLVSGDCCVTSPDYKRYGLQGFAGRFWMKDVSSPTTFSGAAVDMAPWSVCKALNVNECVSGSTAGQYYITAPKRDIESPVKCWAGNLGLAIPCLSAFGPAVGQTLQFRIDRLDATGLSYRKFGFAHSHAGSHYVFSNCRTSPDAQFLFCPGYWLDGVRTEWLAMRMGPVPPVDNVNRTAFLPISLNYQGVPFAANIRARFGYAENGGDLLQCTAYGQDCSTEIPSGSPGDAFSFTNEAVSRQACANGANCIVTIPSLANRVLYYVVDRLDSSGTVLETSPMQAVAVP